MVLVDLRFWARNAVGSFADCAILLPLIAALGFQGGYSTSVLFFTAGLAYLVSGFLFRIPMSIQPLKSIVIAGLAMGASCMEIRVSAALLGCICLALVFFKVNRIAENIPKSLIHGIQVGLGILLVIQGWKYGVTWIDSRCIYAVSPAGSGALVKSTSTLSSNLCRFPLLVSLVLPQLALTLANSVLGTQSAAKKYFGERAFRVTVNRLLLSIGLGNIVSALIGGLPYCHGSGGLTAHYRGGSTHLISNVIIGMSLVVLGIVAWWKGSLLVALPYPLMAGLLIITGLFHIYLAQETWKKPFGKFKLLTLGGLTLISQNLLWVLAFGLGLEAAFRLFEELAARDQISL